MRILISWWWKLSFLEFLLRLVIIFLLNKRCIVKIEIFLRETLNEPLVRQIRGIVNGFFLIAYPLRFNGLNFETLLLLLDVISGAFKIWIEISFASIWHYWRIITPRLFDLNLLWLLVYCLVLNSSLLINFIRIGFPDFLFYSFLWNSLILYRSLNYDFLLFKWIIYCKIFFIFVLFPLLIWILQILCHADCFITIQIFRPFCLSNFGLLSFFLCTWCSWIYNIIQTTAGNKAAFILHKLLEKLSVFDRIQIYLTVVFVFGLRWHFFNPLNLI